MIGDEEIIETEINGQYTIFIVKDNSNAEFYKKASEMGKRRKTTPPVQIEQRIEDLLPSTNNPEKTTT